MHAKQKTENMVEEAEERMKEKRGGKVKKARGGGIAPEIEKIHDRGHKKIKVHKKRGGEVKGKAGHKRLDRRARGGRMGGGDPVSEAGKMSEPPYEGSSPPATAPKAKGKSQD